MQGARHRARTQRAVHGAGLQIGVAIGAGYPVAAVAAERGSAAATRNRACGGPGGRDPATEVPPAATAEVLHPATVEMSYAASAEMRTAATHPTAEMCPATTAAAHSPAAEVCTAAAAEVRTATAAEVCTATAAEVCTTTATEVCTATAAAMPPAPAAAPSAGSRIGRARKRDRQNNNGQRPEFCHATLPSAPRVKKRHDRVFAPYNASMVLRFQNGGSVLAPRHANGAR